MALARYSGLGFSHVAATAMPLVVSALSVVGPNATMGEDFKVAPRNGNVLSSPDGEK